MSHIVSPHRDQNSVEECGINFEKSRLMSPDSDILIPRNDLNISNHHCRGLISKNSRARHPENTLREFLAF